MIEATTDHPTARSIPPRGRPSRVAAALVVLVAMVGLAVVSVAGAAPGGSTNGRVAAIGAADHGVLVPASPDRRHDQAGLVWFGATLVAGSVLLAGPTLPIAGPGARHRDRRNRWRARLEGAPPAFR